jgi:phospholipase C
LKFAEWRRSRLGRGAGGAAAKQSGKHRLEDTVKISRAIAALAAAAAVVGCNSTSVVPGPAPAPKNSIQHVVILMQENRSFNNVFAGFPGATTAMSGPCEAARWCKSGTAQLHSVTLETTGRIGLGTDIDHSHNGFKIECNANASGVCQNNGFDKIRFGEAGGGQIAKLYPYAYIDRSETKAYWDFAKQYALADDMFFTDTASSFIAHQIILSGTVALNSNESLTDQPDSQPWGCDATPGTHTPVLFTDGRYKINGPFPCFTQYGTIADLLDPANVSWKYYVAPIEGGDFSGGVWDGFDAIKKIRYSSDWRTHVVNPNTKVFSDIRSGNLPALSWVIPTLADSDHPASGCNHGPHWVTSVVNAIGQSKYWNSTAVILLWDDWGGWYDPVAPPQTNYTSLGMRVPMVVISPWAPPNTVVHTQYQFGSILRFIEENFGLGSLHTTDATSTSIGDIFNFTQKPTPYTSEPLPSMKKCTGGATAHDIIEHDGGVPE